MSALDKVTRMLWYGNNKDHALANELADEFGDLKARLDKASVKRNELNALRAQLADYEAVLGRYAKGIVSPNNAAAVLEKYKVTE